MKERITCAFCDRSYTTDDYADVKIHGAWCPIVGQKAALGPGFNVDAVLRALAEAEAMWPDPTSAFGPGYGGIPAPSPEPEPLGTPSEQEVIEALLDCYRGGSWTEFVARLERKYGLVFRKVPK